MKHFTIAELTVTNTGLKNIPNAEQTKNLETLVNKVLDPAREGLGFPIIVNSGFRSKSVNKRVGGVPTSQHTTGEAADLRCKDNKLLFDWIIKNVIFDQIINENNFNWVHVSYKEGRNRGDILAFKNGKYYRVKKDSNHNKH